MKRDKFDTYFAKNAKIDDFKTYNRLTLYALKRYISTS